MSPRYDEFGTEIEEEGGSEAAITAANTAVGFAAEEAARRQGIPVAVFTQMIKDTAAMEPKGNINDLLERIYTYEEEPETKAEAGDSDLLKSAKRKIRARKDDELTKDEAMEAYANSAINTERYEPLRKKLEIGTG